MGRARAVARGVKQGPKHKLTAEQRKRALARKKASDPHSAIAETFNVHLSTISRFSA